MVDGTQHIPQIESVKAAAVMSVADFREEWHRARLQHTILLDFSIGDLVGLVSRPVLK